MTKPAKAASFLIAFTVCTLICGPVSYAASEAFLRALSASEGNINLGELRIHPGIEVREEYDDNIYSTAEDADMEDDYITTVTPGLLLSLGTRHKFEIGYALDVIDYAEHDEEDFTGQNGMSSLDLNFPGGLSFGFRDRYEKTKDPRSEENQLRVSHRTNDVDAWVGYKFPADKLSLKATYSQSYLKYDQVSNKEKNKVTDYFGGEVAYRFLPRSTVFAEYNFVVKDFYDSSDEDTDKDLKGHNAYFGLRWDPTAKLSGSLKSGMQSIRYDNEFDPLGNEYEGKDLWAVSGAISFRLRPATMLKFTANRSLNDTEYAGTAAYSGSTYYIRSGGGLSVSQVVWRGKVLIELGGSFHEHDYNRQNESLLGRSDDVVILSAGVTYKMFKRLSFNVSASYYEADSNDELSDERHRKVAAKITMPL